MTDDRKARYRNISDGLLRQRRNLLLISLIMPLFFLSGASIDKINILGTIITIKNPLIVEYSLLILFVYFLLRYWQYYQEETYVKDMHREMHEHVYHLEKSYLNKKAKEKASFLDKDIVSVCFTDSKYSWGCSFVGIPNKKDRVVFPFMRECEFYIYPDTHGYNDKTEDVEKFHSILAKPENSNWHPLNLSNEEATPPSFYREYLKYSIIKFNSMRIIGLFRYVLSTSYFTDYQLPFIVAMVSAGATIYVKTI